MEEVAGKRWKPARTLIWPSLLLGLALVAALVSSVARGDGRPYASAFLAFLSLALAAGSSAFLIPRLLAQIKLDLFEQFRFLRFTRRGGAFVAIILLIAFSALNTGNNLLILILSILMAALVVSGAISNLVLFRVKASLKLPRSIHAGQRRLLRLTLENRKRWFPSFAIRLSGQVKSQGADLELPGGAFPYVAARSSMHLRLPCRFNSRGVYPIEGFEIRTSFPFGFLARGRSLPVDGRLVVYPRLLPLRKLLTRYPRLAGSRERNRRGHGGGLYNIRPYQSGDRTRAIHWKSTAKLSQLMVQDSLDEEESPSRLIFSRHLPESSENHVEQFEKAVSYLASLGNRLHKRGRPFHFWSGDFFVEVNGNPAAFGQFMEFLSCVQPSPNPDLDVGCLPSDAICFVAGRQVGWTPGLRVDYLKL